MKCEIYPTLKCKWLMSFTTRSRIKVPTKDNNIHCLGNLVQCREVKNNIGAIQYHRIGLTKGMTVSKYPSLRDKIKTLEKLAKWGVALGLRDWCLGIWAQWSHLSKTSRKTHLGFDSIYKTQKWFAKRSSGLIYNIFLFFIFRVLTIK